MTPAQRFTPRQFAISSALGALLVYLAIWLAVVSTHHAPAVRGACGCTAVDYHPLAFFASVLPMFLPLGYGFLLMRGADIALLKTKPKPKGRRR